jgi:hypothetical protein
LRASLHRAERAGSRRPGSFDYEAGRQGRFGAWAHYRAQLERIHVLLGELAWQLTADEQCLIDALEACGADFITRQANAA